MPSYADNRMRTNRAFTLPEVLVVIGVIAVLIALLLPALAGALRTGAMAKSQNNMKQVATWSRLYSTDNRETVLPSQFDYTASAVTYPVKVRSDSALGVNRYKGTWTDILWTVQNLSPYQAGAINGVDYKFDSPDENLYEQDADYEDKNAFRSAAPNSRDYLGGTGPTPFGSGALEANVPGFFACNNFFNTGPAPINPGDPPQKWYTTGQIKAPDRSMYLVDSFAGETIEPAQSPPIAPFDNVTDTNGDGVPDFQQVDFRYSGVALMLFMDGHNVPVGPWKDLAELETQRRIKVRNLDRS